MVTSGKVGNKKNGCGEESARQQSSDACDNVGGIYGGLAE